MNNVFIPVFILLIAGILFRSYLISVEIPVLVIIVIFILALAFDKHLSVLFLGLGIFLTGYYLAVPKQNGKISNKPVFLECKVSSYPEVYYGEYRFNCFVIDSEKTKLIGKEITVISDYKPQIFSNIYALGKIGKKHDNLRFYVKKPFIKESKNEKLSFFLRIREYLKENFKKNTLNNKTFAVGSALIFGDRSYLDKKTKGAFINTGLIHLLSISGLHVGIIIGVLIFSLSFISKRLAYIFIIVFLLFYPFISGFKIPVVRASFLGVLYIYGKIRYLAVDPLNLLFFVAFLFTVLNPNAVFSLSFQLSFLAVFGLIISKEIFKINTSNKYLQYFIQSVLVSFIAALWTAPLIIYNFHKFSPTSIFATTFELLILVPYLFLSVLNLFSLFLIKPLVNLMDEIGMVFIKTAEFFDSFGFLSTGLTLNKVEVILFYAILAISTILLKRYKLIFISGLFLILLVLARF